jgi:hypothetical protein
LSDADNERDDLEPEARSQKPEASHETHETHETTETYLSGGTYTGTLFHDSFSDVTVERVETIETIGSFGRSITDYRERA